MVIKHSIRRKRHPHGEMNMNNKTFLMLGLVFLSSSFGLGKPRTDLPRGGMGLLFPDQNSVSNPGQISQTPGSAMQVHYARVNTGYEEVKPSFVFSSKGWSLSVEATRAGTKVSDSGSSSDSLTLGSGMSFGKQRFSAGVVYDRSIDSSQSGSGTIGGVITMQDPKKNGPSLGLKATTTLGKSTNTKAASVGLGYSFKANNSVEGVVEFPDTSSTSDYNLSAFMNLGFKIMYLSFGDTYSKGSASHLAKGRIGAVFGSAFDLSAVAEHTFKTGQNPLIGATLRASF